MNETANLPVLRAPLSREVLLGLNSSAPPLPPRVPTSVKGKVVQTVVVRSYIHLGSTIAAKRESVAEGLRRSQFGHGALLKFFRILVDLSAPLKSRRLFALSLVLSRLLANAGSVMVPTSEAARPFPEGFA